VLCGSATITHQVIELVQATATAYNVQSRVLHAGHTPGATFDPQLVESLHNLVTAHVDESMAQPNNHHHNHHNHNVDMVGGNATVPILASGAGHDAAVFASAGVPSAMLFVRSLDGSHNPNEQMDFNDWLTGLDVLVRQVLLLTDSTRSKQ